MCWRSRTPGVSGGHHRRWLHIDDDTVFPSNKQAHLISGDFFQGTDLLKRPPSERRLEECKQMEGLQMLHPSGDDAGYDKKSSRPSSSGKLLQLTPLWEHVVKNHQIPPEVDKDVLFAELAVRLCDLEWEVRGHALRVLVDLIPVMELSELDGHMMPVLLRELTYNLGHSAPSVRKGALDTLGVYLTHSTDPETVLRNIVTEGLEKQNSNSAAKGNIAMGVILSIPSLVNPLLTPTNGIVLISQTGLIHLVSALSKKLVQDTYQEQSLKTLVKIRRMVGESRFDRFLEGFHPQCKKDFDILCQVYDVINLSDSGIDGNTSTPHAEVLSASNQQEGYWSDRSTPPIMAASSSTISPEDTQFTDQNQNVINLPDKSSSSENVDSSPSPKDEMELVHSEQMEHHNNHVYGGEIVEDTYGHYTELYPEKSGAVHDGSSVVVVGDDYEEDGEKLEVSIEERPVSQLQSPEDEEDDAVTVVEGDDAMDEDVLNSSRVILETEIKFNEDAAIMMTILEEGNKEQFPDEAENRDVDNDDEEREARAEEEGYRVYNNNFVMKVLTDDEDYNDDDDVAMPDHPTRRTPRRVRFGGEMVMMRTPDSEEGNTQQEGADREADIDQQLSEGGSAPDTGYIEVVTTEVDNGAIQAVISQDGVQCTVEKVRQDSVEDARRESLGCTKDDDTFDDYSRRESISFTVDNTEENFRQDSRIYRRQDTLDDARQDTLEEARRESMTYTRSDSVLERQDSFDSTRDSTQEPRQDSLEYTRRVSVQELRQDSLDRIRRESMHSARQDSLERRRDSATITRQDSLESRRGSIPDTIDRTRRESIQIVRQDSLESRRGSIQDARQDSLDRTRRESLRIIREDSSESRRGSLQQNGRQDSLDRTRRESAQITEQESLESRRDSVPGCRRESNESLRRGSIQDERRNSTDDTRRMFIQNERQEFIENVKGASEQDAISDDRQTSAVDTKPGIVEYTMQPAIEIIPENAIEEGEVEEMSSILQSHIPLPVTPARNKPKDHKRRGSVYRKRHKTRNSQTSTDSQEQSSEDATLKQGSGDSANGSDAKCGTVEEEEESGDTKVPEDLGQNWEELGIVTERVLDDLHDQVCRQQFDVEKHIVVHICSECARQLCQMLISEEWVSRIHGIESLSAALKDKDVLQTVLPSLPSLLHCLLVTMAEDRNYRVATSSIAALRELLKSLPHSVLYQHLTQLVTGLTRHIGGSGSVNLKIETVQVAKTLMQIMKPNPVVEILLTPECIGAKSSKMRENSLLFLIYATLTFPSTEFHWDHMTPRVAAAVADPRRRVRQAALDALSVIAQFATPSLLDEAVKSVADKQPNHVTRIAFLSGIQARLSRRQLPTTSPDGLILYVLQIPSARTSGKGTFSGTPIGSDVDWVLAGSGSLSSGSARSRAQLIAAQRLDPQVGIFPPPSEEASSTPPVKKSPWIERKEIVAVQSRASSAGQLAPIDTDKQSEEPKPRSDPRTSWTAELDAGENVGSSTRGHFRPLYVKFDSPPDLSALSNDSVVKGSFSLLPNKLSQSTLAGQGVGQEKLNQTWPPPTSGRRSPRIPKNSKRGRRILEPLNSSNPPDVSPRRGVSPVHRVSPSPRAVSPLPRGASPAHRGVSSSPRGGRSPRGASPVPRSVSPATKGVSPMRVSAGSSGRHKMPPLSPRKKKDRMIVDSGFNVISLGKNEDIIDLSTIRKTRRRKRSTNKGKGIIAIEHDPPLAEQDRAESHAPPPEAVTSSEQHQTTQLPAITSEIQQ